MIIYPQSPFDSGARFLGLRQPPKAKSSAGMGMGQVGYAVGPQMAGHCFDWTRLNHPFGYGSIPINTIFRGMNIHLPAILMFTRGKGFWPIAISSWQFWSPKATWSMGTVPDLCVNGAGLCLEPKGMNLDLLCVSVCFIGCLEVYSILFWRH